MKTGFLLAVFALSAHGQWITQPPSLLRIIQSTGSRPAVDAPTGDPAGGVFLFGVTSLTGRAETWLIETHNSFAGLEQFDSGIAHPSRGRNAGGDDSRTLVAFYRHWWSNRADEAIQALRKARYFQISLYRTGLGNEAEFTELLRARKNSLGAINLDRPDLVYQILSGAPSGTYLVISPLSNLATLDDGVSRSAAGYLRASGAPSTRTSSTLSSTTDLSHENLIFRIEPRFSVVSNEHIESDPGFWKR